MNGPNITNKSATFIIRFWRLWFLKFFDNAWNVSKFNIPKNIFYRPSFRISNRIISILARVIKADFIPN